MSKPKAIWTSEDVALILIDFQKEMFETVRSETRPEEIELNVRFLIRAAKAKGLSVTAEVTPHHVFFDTTQITPANRPWMQMNPPLRSPSDRAAMLEALRDGTADYLATDHAPHESALKDVEFDRAPFGILGFETALALSLEQMVHSGKISLMRMVELFATGPARVLGMERKIAAGEAADLTIFSTDHEWTYNVKDSASKSRNSPFDGRRFKGAPMATIVAGRVVWKK